MSMKSRVIVFVILTMCISMAITTQLSAQEFPNTEEEFKATYAKNIKKSRINGVYIPKDMVDAFMELDNLSTAESKAKFRSGTEDVVAKKLQRAIGQWMIVNWNFYEGSRFSHHIKGIGVSHPEDMAEFMIRSYHRYLNQVPLDSASLASVIESKRKEMRRKSRAGLPIMNQEVRKGNR